MKFSVGLLTMLSFVTYAGAYEIQMNQGRDSYIFDYPYGNRSITVYQIDANEPYSDKMEGLMHDWFIIEDIYGAMGTLPKDFRLRMGRAVGIDNAFAVIRENWRYIVIDPSWLQGHYARIFVIGHELGHHICGHTAGLMLSQPWDRELEADRFAGAVIRVMEQKGNTTFQEAVGNASAYLSNFPSATHPPKEMRLQAALDGYNNGSPCIGRQSGMIPSENHAGSASSPLWEHNGSLMRLVATGASRKFFYESPRQGLGEVGIEKGSLLFEGTKNGDNYAGTAYVYSRRCGRIGFAVSGPVAPDQRSVTVYGQAPIRAENCLPGGYRNETLSFTFLGQ